MSNRKYFTCRGSWVGATHVPSSKGRTLVESILLTWGWICIAGGSRWRRAIAIHHTRWRIAIRRPTILDRSCTRCWNRKGKNGLSTKIKWNFQRSVVCSLKNKFYFSHKSQKKPPTSSSLYKPNSQKVRDPNHLKRCYVLLYAEIIWRWNMVEPVITSHCKGQWTQ